MNNIVEMNEMQEKQRRYNRDYKKNMTAEQKLKAINYNMYWRTLDYECPCGIIIGNGSKYLHFKSPRHLRYIEKTKLA